MINPFEARWAHRRIKAGKKKVGTYPSKFYWDSVNRQFYEKTMPDYAVAEAEFNSRFYFHTVDPEDRDDHDPAGVIKSLPQAEVHGRIFDQPDNPANIIEVDGRKYVNVRQRYYEALAERRAKKAA